MWGAIAAAGGAIIGGAMQANAAKSAASTQAAAAREATEEQRRQFDLTRKDQSPWLNVGQSAIRTIGDLLGLRTGSAAGRSLSQIASELRKGGGFGSGPQVVSGRPMSGTMPGENNVDSPPGLFYAYSDGTFGKTPTKEIGVGGAVNEQALMAEAQRLYDAEQAAAAARRSDPSFGSLTRDFTNEDFVKDPGYEFRLGEGNKTIENAARARGMYMSPSTVKELVRYGQGFASDEFQNAWNRDMSNRTTKFNMLSGASGGGQTAANTLATTGANTASNIGQLITGSANARGAATIAGGNAMAGTLNNVGNIYQQYDNRQQQQKWLDRMFPTNNPYPTHSWT